MAKVSGNKLQVMAYGGGRNLNVRIRKDCADIFEVGTWKRVWHENSLKISSVTLSPDGKKMAFIRDKRWLEIGPFVPQPEEKARR